MRIRPRRECAAMAVRAYNEAIYRETGIENIATIIEKPTLESFNAFASTKPCGCCASPADRAL